MPLESLFSTEPSPADPPCPPGGQAQPGEDPLAPPYQPQDFYRPEAAYQPPETPYRPEAGYGAQPPVTAAGPFTGGPAPQAPISYHLPPVYEDEAGYARQAGHGGQPSADERPAYGGQATVALRPLSPGQPPAQIEPEYQGAPDDGREPHVSVILPCPGDPRQALSEVERISRAMDASGAAYELAAIGDASAGVTMDRLRAAQPRFPRLRVTRLPRHVGPATVRRIGTEQARGDVVVWTEAAAGYPNGRIPEFVAMLDADPALGQVVGARTGGAGGSPARWFARRLAERVANSAIPDLDSGFRAFRRDIARPYLRLLAPNAPAAATLTLAFGSGGHDVRHVPIGHTGRAGAPRTSSGGGRYAAQVLRTAMYFNPLKVLMPLALLLACLGICVGGYDLAASPPSLPGTVVPLFLSGLIIASLALLADLIVRSRGDT